MKKIDVNQAVNPLGEYALEFEQCPLILTDGGHAIAALMPIEDQDLESLSFRNLAASISLAPASRPKKSVAS